MRLTGFGAWGLWLTLGLSFLSLASARADLNARGNRETQKHRQYHRHHAHHRHEGASEVLSSTAAERYTKEQLGPVYSAKYKSQRMRIKYPAFTIPAIDLASSTDGMFTFEEFGTAMPCNDCLLLQMSSDLEYDNGTRADVDTGISLHHAVFLNADQRDRVCASDGAGYPQRFFATGNERTTLEMSLRGEDTIGGYYISASDRIIVRGEIMNYKSDESQRVIFSTTYEYIPLTNMAKSGNGADYVTVEPIWLDVGTCQNSKVSIYNASKPHSDDHARHDDDDDDDDDDEGNDNNDEEDGDNHSISVFSSAMWTSDLLGRVTFTGGHLHNSGTTVQLLKNGEAVCENVATYSAAVDDTGTTTISKLAARHGGSENDDIDTPRQDHIRSISTCTDVAVTKPGDEWSIQALYDTALHMPAKKMDGSLESVMGIAILYVAVAGPNDTFETLLAQNNKSHDDDGDGEMVAATERASWFGTMLMALASVCLLITVAFIWVAIRQDRSEGLKENLGRAVGKRVAAMKKSDSMRHNDDDEQESKGMLPFLPDGRNQQRLEHG